MGGCTGCHTNGEGGAALAGGRVLETEFGTFYTSNTTPDPATRVGGWSTGAFVLAMTEGVSPGDTHYFPSFPYTSYALMDEDDLVGLKTHLDTVEPVSNPVLPHDLRFLWLSPAAWWLEAALLRRQTVRAGSVALGGLGPRCLPGRRARPLRRVPHPARRSRWPDRSTLPGRQPEWPGGQQGLQHHPTGRQHRWLVEGRSRVRAADVDSARRRRLRRQDG